MPQPSQSGVHVNQPLTNFSQMVLQKRENFIALDVFPMIPVEKSSDLYYVFNPNDFLRDGMKPRAESTESAGSGYSLSTVPYNCITYAEHKDISDRVRANSDSVLNSDRNATQWLTNQALIRIEKQWMDDYFVTGKWGTSVTPAVLWDDPTSNPKGDVNTGKTTILLNTGFLPNTLVLSYGVFLALQDHPDVVDRYKYTNSDVVTEQMLAKLFGVDRVLVSKAVMATNVEGEAAVNAMIGGKNALLVYTPTSPGIEVAASGYVFTWKGVSYSANLGTPTAISKFRMEHIKSDRLEIEMAWANQMVGSALGYAFISAVS